MPLSKQELIQKINQVTQTDFPIRQEGTLALSNALHKFQSGKGEYRRIAFD
jgi:hypothetical protein